MRRTRIVLGRIGLAVGCVAILLVLGGLSYQSMMEARDLKENPPPGNLHEVDGTKMHIHCMGSGSPTVVLEQGLGWQSAYWTHLQEKIAKKTRVCGYDRVGLGYSEPSHTLVYKKEVASRIRKLLALEGIEDQMVLVGFSAGGVYIREFYRQDPRGVVGMVFVDSTHEQQWNRLPPVPEGPTTIEQRLTPYLTRFGYYRYKETWKGAASWLRLSGPGLKRAETTLNFSHMPETMDNEWEAFKVDGGGEEAPESLKDLPIFVMSQGEPVKRFEFTPDYVTTEYLLEERRVWDELQLELVALSTRSRHVIAEKSSHAISVFQPELFVSTILEMVQLVREDSA